MTDEATFPVTLDGREVMFRRPIPGQLIILQRRIMRLRAEAACTADKEKLFELSSQLIVDTLDVVESLIVEPEDVSFLEHAMLTGKVTHEQVMDVLGGKEDIPKPVRKKTVPKAAKVTGSRARTKR